jgi:hypothetical protein
MSAPCARPAAGAIPTLGGEGIPGKHRAADAPAAGKGDAPTADRR